MKAERNRLAMVWPILWPLLISVVLLIAAVGYMQHRATPSLPAIIHVEARPGELPASATQWHDVAPAQWKAFELPTKACEVRCQTMHTAWRYRFGSLQSLSDPAVFMPHFDTNIAVFLNGTLVEQQGSISVPPSVHRFHPRLFRLPVGLLRESRNELSWIITIERRNIGSMTPFYIGNYAELASAHQWQQRLSQGLVTGAAWLQLGTLLVALGMFARRRDEAILRWYLLAAPCWLLAAILHLQADIFPGAALRGSIFFISYFALIAFSALFVTSLLERPARWLVRAALGYLLFGTVLTLIAQYAPGIEPIWQIRLPHRLLKYSILIIAPYMLWRLYRHVRAHQHSALARWTFAAALLPAIVGMHDAVMGSIGVMTYVLAPLGGAGIALALWLELARRVLDNQAQMARHSDELAATLSEREAELSGNYDRLREADRERTLSEERGRIMQDMHDGVGGQLATLMYLANDPTVERQRIIDLVREGLADMRLVLDSLNQTDGDLLIALGAFRERIAPLLRTAGIELKWRIDPTVSASGFSPEKVLNIYRLLQEAITNAFKHAGATEITVALNSDGAGRVLSVSDNGRGFAANDVPRNGYGLSGMRQRAAKLGTRLELVSEKGNGTSIRLHLPD